MKTLDVVCGLVWRDDHLLISRRAAKTHLAGFWEFPGGKLESGESAEQALMRELREEVGVEVGVEDLFHETDFTYPERQVKLRFYTCRWQAGEPRALVGVAEVRWVRRDQLDDFTFPPANAALLDKLAARATGPS